MISKVIHYCWFGGKPLPRLAEKCISSWKQHLPDFEIKRWDESNFDVNSILYTQQAAESKKWAFVSDYARFYILHKEGGIYLDCDVEVVKRFDDLLLNQKMFTGFEDDRYVAPGLILGASRNTSLFAEILTLYSQRQFKTDSGYDETTVVTFFTDFLTRKGLILNNECQVVDDITIFSSNYFSPINTVSGNLVLTPDTYSIHHYAGSWLSLGTRIKMFLVKNAKRYKVIGFAKKCYESICK
jgi:hypothetical protein